MVAALAFLLKAKNEVKAPIPNNNKRRKQDCISDFSFLASTRILVPKGRSVGSKWEGVPTSYMGNKEKFSVANVVRNIM